MPYNPLPIIITLVGAYLLTRVGGVLLHPIAITKCAVRTLRRGDNLRSFILALAGTLGVGNVFGVALGIIVGGAGSIFWMLVSVLFSSVLKYSEVLLSTADGGEGGIYNSVRTTFGRGFATVLAIFTVALGLIMGAALQSNTVSSTVYEIFDTPPYITAILLTLAVALGIMFGTKMITRITAIIIPLSTIIYIIMTLSVLIINSSRLGEVILEIITSAFDFRAAGGGVLGFLISLPLREGYSRGILSNEAGAGTSTLAHGTSSATPYEKGVLGIFEVIFDTAVLCPLTALTILVAIPDPSLYASPMRLVLDAVTGTLGSPLAVVLFIAVFIFGYSTMISWYYYVERSLLNASSTAPRVLPIVYLIFVAIGSVSPDEPLVFFTDFILLTLTVIVSLTLIKNSDRLKSLSEIGSLYKSDPR